MSFPADLHVIYTLVDNTDDVLATHPNTLSAEIRYIENKVGLDTSVVTTSVDYFLKHASGAYRTHIHDASSDDGLSIPEANTTFSGTGHGHTGGSDGKTISVGFVTGDWIISSVTTARTGWTNVSATYANRFMRINATPLTTGGADTHTHTTTLATANLPSHNHGLTGASVANESAHTHNLPVQNGSGSGYHTVTANSTNAPSSYSATATNGGSAHTHSLSGNTDSTGSGTAATSSSSDNVPAYVQTVIFQKD